MANKRCIFRILVFLVLAVIATVIYNYHTHDWLTNYIDSTFLLSDPPTKVKFQSAKNSEILEELMELVSTKNPEIYEELIELISTKNPEVLEEVIKLVSPKDPKCRQNNSTNDPSSNFDRTTAIHLAHLLLSYRRQHIRWRKLLLEGNVEEIRTLTWYCDSWCGGLGDRVRGIGFSLMLAMISNRLLLVQWRQPFDLERQNNIFEPAAIDWNLDQALADKLTMLSTASVSLMMTGISKSQKANLIEKYITGLKYRHVRIKTNTVFNGFVGMHQLLTTKTLENKRYKMLMNLDVSKTPLLSDSIQSVFDRYLFKFSPFVLEKAEQIMKEMNMSNVRQYVVVNIRSGFLGTHNEGDYFAVHFQQWEAMLDRGVNKSEELGFDVPVVLCCDSKIVKSWTNAHYNGRVLSIPRKPVHVDHINDTDKLKVETETAAEVVIMSRADFMIRTYVNGFTNVAIHMCPFVNHSELLDIT